MSIRWKWLIWATCLGCGRVSHPQNLTGSNGGGSPFDMPGSAGHAYNAGSSGNGAGGAGIGGESEATDEVQAQPSWRLTNEEYANTVRDLLGVTLTLPLDPDATSAGYAAGVAAGDATVARYHSAAIQLARDALKNRAALVPCSPTEIAADPLACASKFIDQLAPKAFRRPVDAASRAALGALYDTVSARFGFDAGIQAVLEELLQSPNFLYHLELEERALGLGVVSVAGYSMASRLSYLLWASMPDAQLFEEAAAGRLATRAQVRAQALRLLADPRAKLGLRNFYEQWLRVGDLPDAKGGAYASYDARQKASILASFRAQADDALWSEQGGLRRLLAGQTAFYDTNTATLLGLQLAPGGPLQPGQVNAAQRLGILTHPAIMGAQATETGSHPIRRGTFVWGQILCQALPDPPANLPAFSGVPPHTSVRQAFERFDAPASCQSCHARIDPVGFLFETYDTLGAYRTVDDAAMPIDSAVAIVGADDAALNGPVTNAVELVQRLSVSDQVTLCFAKHLFRYATKRMEGDSDQRFLAELAADYAQSGQSTPQILAGLTRSRSFLQRKNVE